MKPMTGPLSGYQTSWFRFDLVAGMTTGAVVIPQSMAYASIAGLPVQAGLYVALVPMFVYACLGSSRPLSVSSTSTLAMLTATQLTLAVPGADPAVVLGGAAAAFLGLREAGVTLTGPIPAQIPAPAWPDLSLLRSLWASGLGMALMSFTESIAAGRAFARHDDPRPLPNRELFALGAANIAGSFFQSFPAGGGTSQTAVNSRAGARTQVSEWVTVTLVVATLLFLSPLISLLPQATLAAVVVVTTLPLLSTTGFRSILLVRRTEFLWALAACAGVVAVGTQRMFINLTTAVTAYEARGK